MRKGFYRDLAAMVSYAVSVVRDLTGGLWALRNLEPPVVAILGGLRTRNDDPHAQDAFNTARSLVQHGFSIITGGGPGIMLAANCGAASVHAGGHKDGRRTLGLGIVGADGGFDNPCTLIFKAQHLSTRKRLLFAYAEACVFFPGGIGTADELFGVLSLVGLHAMKPRIIVLMNEAYWHVLVDWYVHTAMKEHLIDLAPYQTFIVCNTADEAVSHIIEACSAYTHPGDNKR